MPKASDSELLINYPEMMRYCMRFFPDPEIEERPGFMRVKSSIPTGLLNGVIWSQLNEAEAEEAAVRSAAYFRDLALPASWWVTAASSPANLGKILGKHGYELLYKSPAMVLSNPASFKASIAEDLTFEQAESGKCLRDLGEVLRVFNLPESVLKGFVDMAPSVAETLLYFVGYANGEPACSGAVFFGSNCAGIYCIATLEGMRGKGYGAAMTGFLVELSARAGYDKVFLISSRMGYNVYRRLGFEDIGDVEYWGFPENSGVWNYRNNV